MYICITAMCALSVLLVSNAFSDSAPSASVSDKTGPGSSMLQFKAGNHVLGFAPTKAYLAALDHALTAEFLGTKGVMPVSEGDLQSSGVSSGAQALRKVIYKNLWPGITLVYSATRDGITESTYLISPGADVSKIRLQYNVPVELRKNGEIRFKFAKGYVTEAAPVAWQEIDGKKVSIKIEYQLSGGAVGFKVGKYDRTKQLVIDPVYSWHTFYGSSGYDSGNGIVTDSSGNIYVTGYSWYTWNGPSGQSPLHAHSGGSNKSDIFVIKLDSSGTYQWHTFYGLTGEDDSGVGITWDGSNSIYVTGYAGGIWTGPDPDDKAPLNNTGRMFVLKLDTGGGYQWHTFYGSSNNDYGWSVKTDSSGYVYIMGQSSSSWNGPGNEEPLNPYGSGAYNSFVLKLNGSGTYQWHTFYGSGSSSSTNFGFAVDGSGNSYVTGESGATWTGPAPDYKAPINGFTGGTDIFVLKLNSAGEYQWHTFYGSDGYDFGQGIGFDGSSNVYVLGQSRKSWVGPSGQSPLNSYSGSPGTTYDIVLIKLDSSGGYLWHTFYGSGVSYGDGGGPNGIVVDKGGNSYIAGFSPATWGSPLHPHSGNSDILVLKINNIGAHQWHTFYGSTTYDYGYGIALTTGGDLYVTGYSNASWKGDNNTDPLHAYAGAYEAFILKLSPAVCASNHITILETAVPYSSISLAYADALDGQSILAQATVMPDTSLNFADGKSIKLLGGYYECDFSVNPGFTTVQGSVTIGGGPVTLENIIISD
ncbi:MAG TPA: SBBP repeat-containing protein [Dissulfurispiraceae bacterium]|nr:SBBP repeat-containing protein [Dissulfurispiraceae bacterium]